MNFYTQQTHFIGVLPPQDLALTLEECRRYMSEKYGCRSGHATPIHVTLVPPFFLEDRNGTVRLLRAISGRLLHLENKVAFSALVDGFDAFGDRTIFASVLPAPEWIVLRDAVLAALLSIFPGCTKKDRRPFHPHLTVANRDIPAGATTKALEVFREMALHEEFPVDNITVFERHDGKWTAAGSIDL